MSVMDDRRFIGDVVSYLIRPDAEMNLHKWVKWGIAKEGWILESTLFHILTDMECEAVPPWLRWGVRWQKIGYSSVIVCFTPAYRYPCGRRGGCAVLEIDGDS